MHRCILGMHRFKISSGLSLRDMHQFILNMHRCTFLSGPLCTGSTARFTGASFPQILMQCTNAFWTCTSSSWKLTHLNFPDFKLILT
ncbi:hypothetical protein A2U01_0015671 [Trifolium medium]|uniref:Uncharacterized protein n=1 Tax=Trifolium medium TaxID=97028 RepID=A0A392N4F7_9FABA|nr:hypothetical protein [Trifolium medium]